MLLVLSACGRQNAEILAVKALGFGVSIRAVLYGDHCSDKVHAPSAILDAKMKADGNRNTQSRELNGFGLGFNVVRSPAIRRRIAVG